MFVVIISVFRLCGFLAAWGFRSVKESSADIPGAEEPWAKLLALALRPFPNECVDVMFVLIVLVALSSSSNREEFFFWAASSDSRDLIRCSNSVSRFFALSFSSLRRRSNSVIRANDVSVSMAVVDRTSAYKLVISVPGLVYR